MKKNEKKSALLLALLICSIVLSNLLSCTTYNEITANIEYRIEETVIKIMDNSDIKDAVFEEKEIFKDGLENFLEYLYAAESKDIIDELEQIQDTNQLGKFILGKFELSPIEAGYEALTYWDKNSDFDYDNSVLINNQTEHFKISYYENSKAEEQIEIINYYTEYYLNEILRFIESGNIRTENFYANLLYLDSNRISILLVPDSAKLPGNGSNLTISISAVVDEEEKINFQASIEMPYYNTMSLEVLSRAVSYTVDILLRLEIDENAVSQFKTEEQIEEYFTSAFGNVFLFDTSIGSGFTEYIADKFSVFQKYNLLLSPEDRIKHSMDRIEIQSDLFNMENNFNDKDFLILSTQVNSFIGYLIDNYGAEKFLDFYFYTGLETNDFNSIYNMDYLAVETYWKNNYNF